jgi:TetR/AcrR family fatty acid metabolism transcriptional regulator
MKHKGKTNPPGRQKIINSIASLLSAKDFHSITTAEIAETAGVTEGLIYKYFNDKKDLLYQVLNQQFSQFQTMLLKRIEGKKSCIEKLETIIHTTLESYISNRVLAKILLLEVRSSPVYFSTEAYEMVRLYSRTILEIIYEGIERGEIKAEIDESLFRKIILGAIEHACLREIIFEKDLDVKTISANISNILFNGVKT